MKVKRYLALGVMALLLTACAGRPTQVTTAISWEDHSARLVALNAWTARGKLALRTSEQSESASLVWRQDGRNTLLQLSGPMGLKASTITSDGQMLEFRQGDDTRTWDISDPAALNIPGWELPLQALPHWLKGLPAPDSDIQLLELEPDRSRLRKLMQDNWEVRYELYERFGDLSLPTRLRIQRDGTSARVIIRSWLIPPA